jgi:hypothetical protein
MTGYIRNAGFTLVEKTSMGTVAMVKLPPCFLPDNPG